MFLVLTFCFRSLKSVKAARQIMALKTRGSTFVTTNFQSRVKTPRKESSSHFKENQSTAYGADT